MAYNLYKFDKLGWGVYLFYTFYLNAPGVVTKSFVSLQLIGFFFRIRQTGDFHCGNYFNIFNKIVHIQKEESTNFVYGISVNSYKTKNPQKFSNSIK